MLNAKISPSQLYWLPKVLKKYKNQGWMDVDVRMVSWSQAVVYEKADVRIHFKNGKEYLIIYIDTFGKDSVAARGTN